MKHLRQTDHSLTMSLLIRPLYILMLISVSLFSSYSFAGQPETRSFAAQADGYALYSEDKAPAQLRIDALTDARRKLLERAGSYSDADVKVLEQKDFGVEDNNKYHVWIRAEVTYVLKTAVKDEAIVKPAVKSDVTVKPAVKAESVVVMPSPDKAPLFVDVSADRELYREGEKIRLLIKGNKDFYLNMVYQESNGNVLQLLPNMYRPDNFFRADVTYLIPDKADLYAFKVQPPFGKERIFIYASEKPISAIKNGSATVTRGGFYDLGKGTVESVGNQLRGMAIVEKDDRLAEFYETSIEINTDKKK